ncbi:MAG: hypothetical protein V7765_07250 [Oleispira sp.]
MHYLLVIPLLLLSIVARSEVVKPSEPPVELTSAVDSLIHSLNDVYSSSPFRKAYLLPNNKSAVVFTIEGRRRGNNYQQYLAVFTPSQRSKHISGETYENYGPLKYSLVGVLNVGGKSDGGIKTENLEYRKNKLTFGVNSGRWGSKLIKSAGLPMDSKYVTISIAHYGLSVE